MKPHKTKGEILHEKLEECLTSNSKGLPYFQCSRPCSEKSYWVLDKGGNRCFSEKKIKNEQPFCVKNSSPDGVPKMSWLVCVDEGLITNQKSGGIARCDNILFNDQIFYFIEAKMRVASDQWKKEFDDAIKNKIPRTKAFIDEALGKNGYSLTQTHQLGIALPYPGFNNRIPRNNPQKLESLRGEARKHAGKWVTQIILSDTIEI